MRGAHCTGSDVQASEVVDGLRRDGFEVSLEQSADSVPKGSELLVVSAAIRPDHPEVIEAGRRGVTVAKYAQALGELMVGKTGVAIAGTHGKSTTTAMLSHALIRGGLDPSYILGATCDQIGGGCGCGGSRLLIAEACEFDRTFHHLHPTHAVILNVEEDHLDVYGSIDAIVEAFSVFARRLPRDGSLLINHEMAHRLAIVAGLECHVETIGFAPQADWQIRLGDRPGSPGLSDCADHGGQRNGQSVGATGPARKWVQIWQGGLEVARWLAALPGEHMAYNAAVGAVTAHRLGASWEAIADAMADFEGLDRRMQYLGGRRVPVVEVFPTSSPRPAGEVVVVDDYGHHPTEIDTTLRALRQHYAPRRLICVFQPHQHSRTRFLMEQFAASFSEADVVIVPHIYFVRDSEQERHAVSAADLVDRLRRRGKQAMHLYPFSAIAEQLEVIARPGDLVVTMGAGDVWKIAREFLDAASGQG